MLGAINGQNLSAPNTWEVSTGWDNVAEIKSKIDIRVKESLCSMILVPGSNYHQS